MSGNMDAPAENIVIIRRKSCGEDDCHHGGVWKIAYADFMTAMMAFFLVMWLINAANTEVKASVASYFNPMRLTDSVARSKGLKDAPDSKSDQKDKKRESEAEQGSQNAPGDATSGSGGGKDATGEAGPPRKQAFDFDDEATGARRNVANSKSAALPGTAFRDPFNPLNPAQMLPVESTAEKQAAPPADPASGSASIDAPAGKSASIDPVEADKASAARVEKTVPAPAATQPGGDEDAAETAQDAKERREMAALVDQVGKATRDAAARLGLSGGPAVDVTVEGDMVVVSLAETASFEMFKVGSAEPNGDLVKLLGTIVPAITANNERLIIRGHTDARPFRNAAKNNWQLSVERAEAAFQILLKAGVDESRFERIEAHADQMLKNKADPEAASNRRIEILLRKSSG